MEDQLDFAPQQTPPQLYGWGMATGTTKPPRKPVPAKNETAVLTKSARRCPLCYHLNGDLTEKVGQIAHLDGDRTNGAEDNLAWMCMTHHSVYDSTTSQHKNYTLAEVKTLRTRLYEAIERGERGAALMTSVPTRREKHNAREDDRYLFSTDAELGSAIKMMAWASAWGKWFSAQLLANQDRPIDKEGVDRQVMQIAASLVTDAAMDGKLEVRGRRPDGISYEVIPREAWRLIALVMHPDLHSLWRAALIPRGVPVSLDDGKLDTQPPSRVAHIFDYDSLIVDSRQFEELWPKKDQATDEARERLLQTAEQKGVVDHDVINGRRG
jgi:hypothetical protein